MNNRTFGLAEETNPVILPLWTLSIQVPMLVMYQVVMILTIAYFNNKPIVKSTTQDAIFKHFIVFHLIGNLTHKVLVS